MGKTCTRLLFIVLCFCSVQSYAIYCTPGFTVGCTFGGTQFSGDLINNVITTGGVTNISNLNTGCSGSSYTFYNTLGASQIQGQTVNLSLQSGSGWSQGFRVWIDWNQDEDFADPGEDVFVSTVISTAVQTGSFTVPFSALTGLTRMRVMCRFAVIPNLTDHCASGMVYGECEDYNFTVIAATPCTGQPVAGTTTSSIPSPCIGQSFVLGLSGTTAAGSLTYQWIQSTTGNPGTWTTIAGATSNFYGTSVTTNMCYRCIVTCTPSTLYDTSSSLCINPGIYSPYSSCYCPVTNQGSSCITNVSLGTLNNSSTGCTNPPSNYFFYTTIPVPNLTQGLSYTFTVTTDAAAITSFWIDYNHNTNFEPTEWYQPDVNATVGDTVFTIPFTSIPGQTRMRVRSRLPNNQNGSGDACIAMGSGETEDYIINILPAADYDPAVLQLNTPNGNCFSANSTFSAVIANYGQLALNTAVNPVNLVLNVQTPSGPAVYTVPVPPLTMAPMGQSTYTVVIPGVNLFNGGLYTVNTDITVSNPLYNGVEIDDSLASPITLQNYRPKPGPAYHLCQGSSIPIGQGLSVSGCATPVIDSVTIPFTLMNPGFNPCNPLQANILGSCHFATGTLPVLPNPTFLSAELTVTNLATVNGGFASETRFPFFKGSVPGGIPLYASAQGNAAAASSNYTWYNNIPVTNFAAVYDSIMNGTGVMNIGYHSTWGGNATSNGFTQNAGGQTTTVNLKIKYSYVPNNYSWYETISGGTSIYNSSPFDPLSVTNNIVTNSNTPGTYIFFVACSPSPNCRARDTLIIDPSPTANNISLHTCETAVASNTGIFDLLAASPLISSNPNYSIDYFYDPGFFLPIPSPAADTTGSSTVYVKVVDPANGCVAQSTANLLVDTLPDVYTLSQGLVCQPASLNAFNLLYTSVSTIPSTATITYWANAACTIPHPNPTNITAPGNVYIVVNNTASPGCADTVTGIVNIGATTNTIVNQQYLNNNTFTNSLPSSTNPINTSVTAFTDGQTGEVLTANCLRVVGIQDYLNGISLGNVSADVIVEDVVPVHVGQPYLKRHFKITPTNQDSARVCLYVLNEDINEFNFEAVNMGWPEILSTSTTLLNAAVSKVDNGDLNTAGHTVTVIPPSDITSSFTGSPDEVWSLCFDIDSFSYFYIHTSNPGNAALPLVWKSFTAKRVNQVSELDWITSMEKNNHYFLVERSKDGKNFTAISDAIPTKAVQGNSETPLSYTHTDPLPFEGHNYYRIRQIDLDGRISSSKVIDVYFGNDSKVTVYPNPADQYLNVDISITKASPALVQLIDATGRIVKTIQSDLHIGDNTVRVELDDLADGVYMVKVTNNKGLNYSQSIRKN